MKSVLGIAVACVVALACSTSSASAACKQVPLNAIVKTLPSDVATYGCLQATTPATVGQRISPARAFGFNFLDFSNYAIALTQSGIIQADGSTCPIVDGAGCVITVPGTVRVNIATLNAGKPDAPMFLGIADQTACTKIDGADLAPDRFAFINGGINDRNCVTVSAQAGATYSAITNDEGANPVVDYSLATFSGPGGAATNCALGSDLPCFTAPSAGTYTVKLGYTRCLGSPLGCLLSPSMTLAKVPTTCAGDLAASNPGQAAGQTNLSSTGTITCRRLTNVGRGNWLDVSSASAKGSRVSVASADTKCGAIRTYDNGASGSRTATTTCQLTGAGPWNLYEIGDAGVSVQRRATVPQRAWNPPANLDFWGFIGYWLGYLWEGWFPQPAPLNVDYPSAGSVQPSIDAAAKTAVPMTVGCPPGAACAVDVAITSGNKRLATASTQIPGGQQLNALPITLDATEVRAVSAASAVTASVSVASSGQGARTHSLDLAVAGSSAAPKAGNRTLPARQAAKKKKAKRAVKRRR